MAKILELYGHGYKTVRAIAGALNALLSPTRVLNNPALEIRSNFDVQNGAAVDYMIGGVAYSIATDQAGDTGTAATFAADTWGIALVTVDTAGALTVTWKTNDEAGYATEALAIAALEASDVPAGECVLGYVTVQTASGQTFTAGTDALQGGTGGNASADTNYYNDSNPNGIVTPLINFPDGAAT